MQKNRSQSTFWACLIAVSILALTTAQAQIPTSISYQGRLKQNNQLVNGTFQLTFRLYDPPAGGSILLWTEVHPAVTVTNGQFDVELGTITTFDSAGLTFDIQYFLGMEVDFDGEMVPRKPFTSVGYALNALHAQDSDHANNSDNANNADHSNNSDNANNSNRSNRSDFSEGVKEDKVAVVMMALRGGGTPVAGSAIYTDPVAAMNDLATWCGTPSALNPCLLRIMPGIYNLAASNLVTQSYVDIVGAGPNSTNIALTGQVLVVTKVNLRGLSIEKQGGAGAAVEVDGEVRLQDMEVRVGPGVNQSAIYCGAGCLGEFVNVRAFGRGPGAIHIELTPETTLNNVTVSTEANLGAAVGILIKTSSPTLTNVSVSGTAPGVASITGVLSDNNTKPVLRDMIITVVSSGSGTSYGVRNENNSEIDMENTRVNVEGISGSVYGFYNNASGARLVNMTIDAHDTTGSGETIGVRIEDSTVELIGVTVRSSSPGSATCVENNGSSTVTVDRSILIGDSVALRSLSGAMSFVAASKLDGTVAGNPSFYTCVGAYDGIYAELDSQCQ